MKCPYCDGYAHYVDSIKVYKTKSYGGMYLCENYPKCDSYVGCHAGTTKALGRLANRELRYWKKKTHNEYFDPLWKGSEKVMKRKEAYAWAAKEMEMDVIHIGELSVEECKKLINKIKNYNSKQITLDL